MNFDLIINNTIIIDGTKKKRYLANIGITGDRISKISINNLTGKNIIDANNELITAPGFIDMHSHSDLAMFYSHNSEMKNIAYLAKISQGVTTELVGQDGFSVAPIVDSKLDAYADHISGLTGRIALDRWSWNSIDEYLAEVPISDFPGNIVSLIGHSTIRIMVMGYDNRSASKEELEKMCELLRQNLRSGGLGMSMGLIYTPGMYADYSELKALADILVEENKILVAHVRNESKYIFEAMEEMHRLAVDSGVHVHISHLKICGNENILRGDELISKLMEYSNNNFTFDMYPYDAGSTMLQAILPPWALEGGRDVIIDRLASQEIRDQITLSIFEQSETEWENFIGISRGGLEGIIIASTPPEFDRYIGKSLADIGRMDNIDPSTEDGVNYTMGLIYDLLRDTKLAISMISFNQSMINVDKFLKLENMMTIGTDGIIGKSPHPRLYGAHTAYLQWVIENNENLENAIHNMTQRPSLLLNIEERTIQEGGMADLVVLNPNELQSCSNYDQPLLTSKGIKYTIIAGAIVYSID